MFVQHHSEMPSGPANFAVPGREPFRSAPSILVVDDTTSAREPLARLLRLAGYQTACAADGQEALAEMERRIPDLVLLDLMMPRVDGLAFLQQMRKNRRFKHVPVILVTATDTAEQLAAARQLGVQDCLLKAAFTVPELLERIARQLKPN